MELEPHSIFELAGKKTLPEFDSLLRRVTQIVLNEKQAGQNKLKGTIDKTRLSPNGQEYFVDGGIAYLPLKGKAIFVGDTHGDSITTEKIINDTRFIQRMRRGEKDLYLVFLGDYTDRGKNDIRNIEILLNLKEEYSNNVILLRGNHEDFIISLKYKLLGKFERHFKDTEEGLFSLGRYHRLTEQLPSMLITGNGIVGVHGGIPNKPVDDLLTLKNNEKLFDQIRWNDPSESVKTTASSSRGEDERIFGIDHFNQFMKAIGGKAMIRSHQSCFNEGYKFLFDNRLVTIFSNGGKSNETAYPEIQPKILKINLARTINMISLMNISKVELD